jgi:transcriptional regulator of heat shock response
MQNTRLDKRKEIILRNIVDMFVDDCTPVSSASIMNRLSIKVSSATIRNEMAALEDGFLIHQPHTSSGRIPTVQGYRYYVDYLLDEPNIKSHDTELFRKSAIDEKTLAKEIARVTDNAVFLTTGGLGTYYTGISHLLKKPEFFHHGILEHIGRVVDEIDDIVLDITYTLKDNEVIIIGDDHFFGPSCSAVVGRVGRDKVFGILGPIRMKYNEARKCIRIFKELFH